MKKDKILKIFYIIILLVIIFFPKINVINVPGTYIGIRIEDFLVAIFSIIYICKKRSKILKFESKELRNVVICFFIYLLVCCLSNLNGIINNNIQPAFGMLYLVRKLEYFIFIFIGFEFFRDVKNEKVLFRILDISVIVHFVIAVLQSLGVLGGILNGQYVDTESLRVFSTFNGPYEFSVYLTILLPLYIVNIVKNINDKKQILKSIVFIMFIITSVYLSQSRTSLIILIILLVIVPILEMKDKIFNFIKLNKFKAGVFVFIFLSLITIISVFLFNGERFKTLDMSTMLKTLEVAWENKSFDRYQEEGFYVVSGGKTDYSFAIRINKWMALIDGTLEHPILGLGLSVTKEACDGNYIRILAESGTLGLLCWLLLIACIFKSILKRNNEINVIAKYGLIVLLLTAIFIDVFEASKIMMFYWFILGCVYSSYNVLENSNIEEG